jgi:hypothetical protein
MERHERGGPNFASVQKLERCGTALCVGSDRGGRSRASDAERLERRVEVVARVDARRRGRARVNERNPELRELPPEKRQIRPGGNERERPQERQKIAIPHGFVEKRAKRDPVDGMDAARESRGESQTDRGLRPDELDGPRGTREPPERSNRRKREKRIPQSARADGEDAAALDRW